VRLGGLEIRRSRGSPLNLNSVLAWLMNQQSGSPKNIMHATGAKCRSEMIDRMQIHLQLRRTFASFLGARLRSSGVHA
jgi:hypothetical protein